MYKGLQLNEQFNILAAQAYECNGCYKFLNEHNTFSDNGYNDLNWLRFIIMKKKNSNLPRLTITRTFLNVSQVLGLYNTNKAV